MIFGDFLKALGQIGDSRILRVMALGVLMALGLLFGLYGLMIWGINLFLPGSVNIPFIGQVDGLTTLFGWGSLVLVLVLSVFLMVPVASVRPSAPQGRLEAAGAANLFVVRDGIARLTRVQLGALHDGAVEVRDGLEDAALVVANPPRGLEDRHRVGTR